MSQERTVDNKPAFVIQKGQKDAPVLVRKDNGRPISAEEAALNAISVVEREARILAVMERGYILDRATVENLPPDLHGEWVNRDPLEVERKKAIGFWVDTEYAPNRALHSDGSKTAMIGDVVYMVTTKENKRLIDEVRHRQYIKQHGDPRAPKRSGQKEEGDFKRQVDTRLDLPVVEEGGEKSVQTQELADALGIPTGER